MYSVRYRTDTVRSLENTSQFPPGVNPFSFFKMRKSRSDFRYSSVITRKVHLVNRKLALN